MVRDDLTAEIGEGSCVGDPGYVGPRRNADAVEVPVVAEGAAPRLRNQLAALVPWPVVGLDRDDVAVGIEDQPHPRGLSVGGIRRHLDRARTTLNALLKATPDDSETSFLLVEVHLAFLDLARKEKSPEARREHAEAAKTLLDAMTARGQVAGVEEREAARERVDKELASLTP